MGFIFLLLLKQIVSSWPCGGVVTDITEIYKVQNTKSKMLCTKITKNAQIQKLIQKGLQVQYFSAPSR
jgi:hypothetical protein